MRVELAIVPGQVFTYELEEGSTIQNLIETAEEENVDISFDGETTVNNSIVRNSFILRNGDRVLVTKKVKGNNIRVTVAKIPGVVKTVELNDGATVRQALEQAEITDYESYQMRDTAGNEVSIESIIARPTVGDARLTLTKRVKGNNIHVTVAKIPGVVKTVELNDGATVRQALEQAEITDYESYQMRDTAGNEVSIGSIIARPTVGDARLTLTKRVKGN